VDRDAVALSSLTPFSARIRDPVGVAATWICECRRVRVSGKQWTWAARKFWSLPGFSRHCISYLFGVREQLARSAHLFYLFFLPLIWMPFGRGIRGVVVAPDRRRFQPAIMMRVVHQGIEDLASCSS